ncbi:DUF5623 domain-containing protein [Ottowia sp. VDI28]|uniref:DUF5623 domain-containing protein n=1 Tax=Ottowia sp. VDI28 TaxID=3133968 RepID=UPI003C2E990B
MANFNLLKTGLVEWWVDLLGIAAGENHGLKVSFITNGDDEQIEILGPLPPELRRGLLRVAPLGQSVCRGQLPGHLFDISWCLNATGNGTRFGIWNLDELVGLLDARRLILAGKGLTLAYTEGRKKLLRPGARMPLADHARVGLALKTVYDETFDGIYGHAGIARRLRQVKSALNTWMLLEYWPELTDNQFENTYFGDVAQSGLQYRSCAEKYQAHILLLKQAKIILAYRYPNCAPLLEVLRKLDYVMDMLSDR